MAKTNRIHFEVLNRQQRGLLTKLSFLKKDGFYLAGGTALALQIGHRTSMDLDFYRQKGFIASILLKKIKREIKDISVDVEREDTLILKFKDSGISLFKYDYPVIRPFIATKELLLLSLEDIAAMKIVALMQRGRKRDFVDMYFLLEKFGIENILKFSQEKYGYLYNEYAALRSLTYFEDADKKEEKDRFNLLVKIGWNEIKKGIVHKVNLFLRQRIF